MNPLLTYILILLVPVALAVALRYVIVVPRRECLNCRRSVATTAPRCRHCGYRFFAEDRKDMAKAVSKRQRRYRRSNP
jgi:DNA-directed RNA polymerase subunit RPC12/RpoP